MKWITPSVRRRGKVQSTSTNGRYHTVDSRIKIDDSARTSKGNARLDGGVVLHGTWYRVAGARQRNLFHP